MTMAATPSPGSNRMFLVLSFVAGTIFTGIVGLAGGYIGSSIQSTRAERSVQTNRFVDATLELDPLFKALMIEVKAGRVKESTKDSVSANIQKQYRLVENAQGLLPEKQQKRAERYKQALLTADDALDDVKNKETARPFVQAIVHTVEQRPYLIAEMRQSAGLPATSPR